MKRLLAAVCTALTLATVATGCGAAGAGSATVHGRVTGKDYEPARTTWTWQPTTHRVCTTKTRRSGKTTRTSRSCHTVRTGRHKTVHHTPACWLLQLDTGATVCTTSRRWHHTHTGDHYQGVS